MTLRRHLAICIFLIASAHLHGQVYEVLNLNSGMVLDVTNMSTDNGALIQQWTWLGGANQQWQFIPLGNGYNEVQNINSGKVLDVYGGYTTGGTPIQQWDWLSGGNQQWQVVPLGNGYNAIFNLQSGMVLDVRDFSVNGGAAIQQWTWLGGANQQWQLIPVDSSGGGYVPAPPPPVPSTYAFTSSASGIVYAPKSNNTAYFICYDGYGYPLAGCGITLYQGWYPQTNAHLHTTGGQP
ncbi:MAG TPA: RICIN domain-containing protein, partial [Bryobacteraceae bacterium]|nr:RICIN domain-containing protein [Bryobacteraceae bacterium]